MPKLTQPQREVLRALEPAESWINAIGLIRRSENAGWDDEHRRANRRVVNSLVCAGFIEHCGAGGRISRAGRDALAALDTEREHPAVERQPEPQKFPSGKEVERG